MSYAKIVLSMFGVVLCSFSMVHAEVNIVELTAQEIAEAYDKNQLTAVEVTQAYLDRIAAFELNYNAFTTMNSDAMVVAAALDQERMTSGSRGPLHGVPVVIKESIDVAGMPSTAGLAELSSQAGGVDLIPTLDAPVVARLKEAGAIILGKTNVPGFSLDGTRTTDSFIPSWDGPTYNSYDRRLAPGASSAGTATGVSASFGVLGLGEETGGSIQNPAGAQNLVGIKPTFGLVPNTGVVPIGGSTRDVIGPMAKTVYDAAIALDVIAGPTPGDPKTEASGEFLPVGGFTSLLSTTALEGKRIGVYGTGWNSQTSSSETQRLYESALQELVNEGVTLIDDPLAGTNFRNLDTDFLGAGDFRGYESMVYDVEQYLDRILATDPGETALDRLTELTGLDLFGGPLRIFPNNFPEIQASLGDPDAAPDLSEFLAIQSEYREIFTAVMEENDLDAFVYPQMLQATPGLTENRNISSSTVDAINIMGTPGVTVPAGYYENGSPFSLMFLGDLFSEAELLAMAYDYEQATLHRNAPNLIHVADADQDGRVAFSDFLILSQNFGRRRSGPNRGDFDGNRRVDFADFLFLSQHFGYGSPPSMGVPEPTGFTLLLIALSVIALRRRNTRCL